MSTMIEKTDEGAHDLGAPRMYPSGFAPLDQRKKSPFLASFLSVIPGLGQVYVGYYQRGFIHILVAGSVFSMLIALTAADNFVTLFPLGIVFLIFFELYNVIDAGRRALLYNLTLDGVEQVAPPDDLTSGPIGGTYIGGGALVAFGCIALSHTAFGVPLDWLATWWPVAPLALEAYLVFRAWAERN